MVPGPRATSSPGNLLEMKTDRPQPRPTESNYGDEAHNLFNLPFDSDVH